MSQIVFNSPSSIPSLESQVDSMQTTLAFLNQQTISLQESLQKKDQIIFELTEQLKQVPEVSITAEKNDQTLTIVELLINLYQFIFLPNKK